MDLTSLVGWAGTSFLGLAAVPQTVKVWREGHARGMSWAYVLLLLSGFLCMLVFSLARGAGTPLVTSYGLQVFLFVLIALRKAFPK